MGREESVLPSPSALCASWDVTEGHLRAVISVLTCPPLLLCVQEQSRRLMAAVLYSLAKSSWMSLLCPLNLKGDLKKK